MSDLGRYVEWTDDDGQRVVINGNRISVYGSPSMTNDSGQVAIGADIPPGVSVGAYDELTVRGQNATSNINPRRSSMDLQQAQQLIGEAVENPSATVSVEQLALACATVLLHGGLMALKPLELPQNTVLIVQEQ